MNIGYGGASRIFVDKFDNVWVTDNDQLAFVKDNNYYRPSPDSTDTSAWIYCNPFIDNDGYMNVRWARKLWKYDNKCDLPPYIGQEIKLVKPDKIC